MQQHGDPRAGPWTGSTPAAPLCHLPSSRPCIASPVRFGSQMKNNGTTASKARSTGVVPGAKSRCAPVA
eukprot:11165730-Lingulodinium_polyedra.AAC.1